MKNAVLWRCSYVEYQTPGINALPNNERIKAIEIIVHVAYKFIRVWEDLIIINIIHVYFLATTPIVGVGNINNN